MPADYKIIDVEAPEMVAAIERGDIDAFATWEPWPTRALMNVKDTKILQDAEGIYNNINFVYMNRTWIEKNEDTAVRFIRSLVEANDLIGKDRPAAAAMVSKFLKMPIELARELMPKVEYNMTLSDRAVATIKISEEQLQRQGKLKAPLDYSRYVYTDLLKKVRPGEREDHVAAPEVEPTRSAVRRSARSRQRLTCRAGRACSSSLATVALTPQRSRSTA